MVSAGLLAVGFSKGQCRPSQHDIAWQRVGLSTDVSGGADGRDKRGLIAHDYGSTVCINITLYADHSDRLKYRSFPVDQGCRYGA